MPKQSYDSIYIGCGIVSILDAINLSLNGKAVLMIERSSSIGGAWKCISPFDSAILENAVHYLMARDNGYRFIEEFLDVRLSPPGHEKYLAFKCFGSFFLGLSNSPAIRFFHEISSINLRPFRLWNIAYCCFNSIFASSLQSSRYPCGGALDILKRLQSLVDRSGLDIEYNSHVTSIECQSDLVVVRSTDKFWLAKEVVFGHGILPPRTLTIDGQLFSFNMVKERRPSLHFKVIPNRQNLCKYHNSTISQVVFPRGSLIKYCHNLNKFIQDARCSALYLVVALRHSSQNSLETVSSVVSMLINYGIMPPERQIASLEYFWQDVYLPLVTTHELERIELASNMRVRTLLTEELCGGLGKYSEHWHALKSWIRQNPFP